MRLAVRLPEKLTSRGFSSCVGTSGGQLTVSKAGLLSLWIYFTGWCAKFL